MIQAVYPTNLSVSSLQALTITCFFSDAITRREKIKETAVLGFLNVLGGLLSSRFALVFFTRGLALRSKGFAFALAVKGSCDPRGTRRTAGAVAAFSLFFLRGFLVGLFASWHRGILNTFSLPPAYVFALTIPMLSNSYRSAHHPTKSLMLLPKIPQGICFANVYLGGGIPCFILGLLLSLVVAFLDQCKTSCCCPDSSLLLFHQPLLEPHSSSFGLRTYPAFTLCMAQTKIEVKFSRFIQDDSVELKV